MKSFRRLAIVLLIVLVAAIIARVFTPPLRIEFVFQYPPASTWDTTTFSAMNRSTDHQKFIAMIHGALGRHSDEFIRATGLKAIVFVDQLAVNGQKRMAVPDFPKGLVYLDPSIGAGNSAYQLHAFQHELFHLLMGTWKGDQYFHDPEWMKLNAPGTSNGPGGASTRGSENFPLTHPNRGFINIYSQTGVEEDMAEVFACMVIDEERAQIERYAKDDPFLRDKLDYMESLMRKVGGDNEVRSPKR